MGYVRKYRLVETRWDGSQAVSEYDTLEEAEEWKLTGEEVYDVFLPQYQPEFKIEEVFVMEDVKGHSLS